jgi:hypothetical protein
MTATGKYIGINQRIPFDVLDAALYRLLRDKNMDKNSILSHLKEFTKGENRANKAAQYAVQILSRQENCINELNKTITAPAYLKLPITDRKAIVLALAALTYPIIYDLLIALATGFKVQSQINRQFINLKMASIYGSNRTLDIALDALMPMIIELNTIERVKISLYALTQKSIISYPAIIELLIYTDIKLSGSKSILVDDLQYRPWYMFFEVTLNKKNSYTLFKYDESRIGQGYLTINGKENQ